MAKSYPEGRRTRVLARMLPGGGDMTQKLNDPDLDRLVQELNQQEGEEALDFEAVAEVGGKPELVPPELDLSGRARVQEGESLDLMLVELIRQRASDLL